MALRHGFKAESNAWSRDLRSELGLSAQSPICTRRLCAHLELPLLDLSEIEANPAYLAYFLSGDGRKTFSAVTVRVDGVRWIIHNDAHDEGRQAANIAHEIAHALLGHSIPTLFGNDGQRSHNEADEEEAKWLGPALLISDEAALFIASSGMSVSQAATFYGASEQVVQMRINVCAARKRVA